MVHVHTSRDMQSVVIIELIFVLLSGAYYCVYFKWFVRGDNSHIVTFI